MDFSRLAIMVIRKGYVPNQHVRTINSWVYCGMDKYLFGPLILEKYFESTQVWVIIFRSTTGWVAILFSAFLQMFNVIALFCKTKLILLFELLIMTLLVLVITIYYLYHKYCIFCD